MKIVERMRDPQKGDWVCTNNHACLADWEVCPLCCHTDVDSQLWDVCRYRFKGGSRSEYRSQVAPAAELVTMGQFDPSPGHKKYLSPVDENEPLGARPFSRQWAA